VCQTADGIIIYDDYPNISVCVFNAHYHLLTVMRMRKGELTEGIEFFELLHQDQGFCEEFGRAMLSAGKLEAEFIAYMKSNDVSEKFKRASLGKLINYAKKHNLLEKIVPHLTMVKKQRDYLAHNIYALFSGAIEETMLERSGLLDSDIDLFTERARQLQENINHLSGIIANEKYTQQAQ